AVERLDCVSVRDDGGAHALLVLDSNRLLRADLRDVPTSDAVAGRLEHRWIDSWIVRLTEERRGVRLGVEAHAIATRCVEVDRAVEHLGSRRVRPRLGLVEEERGGVA